MIKRFIGSISDLTGAILAAAVELQTISEWLRSHSGVATKHDLEEMEKRIMSALTEEFKQIKAAIIEGTTELTAKIAALEASLGNDTLSADSRTALDELKAAAETLAAIVPNPEATPGT